MKKLFYLFALVLMTGACTGNKDANNPDSDSTPEDNDSTLYGVCGDGTTMHVLELVSAMNDTVYLNILDEDPEIDTYEGTLCLGGLMSGDRIAATAQKLDDGTYMANRIINLTSMLGKWSNTAKLFELTEDGTVLADADVESKPWTSWRILNGQLLLDTDTFNIDVLDADMLGLGNNEGLFIFTRVKANTGDADL